MSKRTAAYIGLLPSLLVVSVLITFVVFLGLRHLGLLREPETVDEHKILGELAARLMLFLFVGALYVTFLANTASRAWFLAARYRLVILALFPLGAAFALGDPFHAISAEGNWIRYWTAGVLALGGVVGLGKALSGGHPAFDRLVGAGFGCLLLAAGTDEIFQFHELAAGTVNDDSLTKQDVVTLGIAIMGLLVLAAVLLVRRYGGWLGRILREERYRVPLRLFAFAVITFLVAMSLDSFDATLRSSIGIEDRFWIAVADLDRLANATEELLEYLAALALLMMVGKLFSVEALGCGGLRAGRDLPAE